MYSILFTLQVPELHLVLLIVEYYFRRIKNHSFAVHTIHAFHVIGRVHTKANLQSCLAWKVVKVLTAGLYNVNVVYFLHILYYVYCNQHLTLKDPPFFAEAMSSTIIVSGPL